MMLGNIENKLTTTPKLLGTAEISMQQGQVFLIPAVNPLYEQLSVRWEEINNALSSLQAEKEYLDEGLQSGGRGLFIVRGVSGAVLLTPFYLSIQPDLT